MTASDLGQVEKSHGVVLAAALTHAFSSDSTPEILASAVHACAVFVGCGVVKDVRRMSCILKLFTITLEQLKDLPLSYSI